MPSGAKKRKAARKKKEQENNINPSTNNPQGDDDLKSQDERGSDGGEGDSPGHHESGDHDHPFNDGSEEVEEIGDPSAAQPFASEVNSVEDVSGDVKIDEVLVEKEDSVVLVERALQSEESSEGRNENFEHNETANELYSENRSTGGISNGESLTEENTKDVNDHSFEETNACHELVESSDSSPSKLTLTTESALIEEKDDSAAENPVNSVKAAASVSEVENGDTGSGSVLLEKSIVPSLEVTNLAMKVNEDNAYPLTDENAATSNLEEPKPKEYDSKTLTSSSASPVTGFTNGAEHFKNSETPEFSEIQPHVRSAPIMVQKTSWLSCCGLFEVLSGSNR